MVLVVVATVVVKIEIRVSIGKTSHNFVFSGKFSDTLNFVYKNMHIRTLRLKFA